MVGDCKFFRSKTVRFLKIEYDWGGVERYWLSWAIPTQNQTQNQKLKTENRMKMNSKYYQAGSRWPADADDIRVNWSNHTRLSFAAAAREARKMARTDGPGYTPTVSWWDRANGMHPDWACVEGHRDLALKTQN